MRVLFVVAHCPICEEVELGIQRMNANLPVGERIQLIDIFSNDPRLSYLAKKFNTWDKGRWVLPVLVLDKPMIKKRFNTYYKGFSRIEISFNIRSLQHYLTLLENYLSPQVLS